MQPVSLSSVFDGWCSNIYHPDDKNPIAVSFWDEIIEKYSFKLRCVVSVDIPPRHSIFSWIRGMGITKFDEIFEEDIRLPDGWLISFPERHCSVHETAALIHTLVKINKNSGLPMKKLDIITQSPMIISDCMSQIVSLISFKKGKKTYDQDYMM